MPCQYHNHHHWPESGNHRLAIEACEKSCGWCDYKTEHANNLRVHARRHAKNPNEESLQGIVVVSGTKGRTRVSRKTNRDSIPLPDDHHDGHKVDALAQKVHSPDMEPTEGEDNRLEEKENIRLRRRIASLEQILRDNKIDFEDALRQDAHQGRKNDVGTKDALVGLYMLANTKATAVQQPQPALLNGLNLRPLQTERPFNKSKSAPPAETEKVQKYQATMWEMGKQRAQAMEYVPDYFSLPLQAHYAGEENPFETSFAGKGNVESETPGGTKLPFVAALTSPASGFQQRSLRSGPLSPPMLSGPQESGLQRASALSLLPQRHTVWI